MIFLILSFIFLKLLEFLIKILRLCKIMLKKMEFVENIADKIGEITVYGNGGMVKQLKEIFATGK